MVLLRGSGRDKGTGGDHESCSGTGENVILDKCTVGDKVGHQQRVWEANRSDFDGRQAF